MGSMDLSMTKFTLRQTGQCKFCHWAVHIAKLFNFSGSGSSGKLPEGHCCEIMEGRKKCGIAGIQPGIMGLEEAAGLFRVRHIGCPLVEASKTIKDALFVTVVVQPVLGPHIGKEAGKSFGENSLQGADLL